MDFKDLEAFVGICRTGNFTRAARGLETSQPNLSRRLVALENAMGAALIERRSGGAAPTEAGAALLPHAEAALAHMRDGLAAVQALRQGAGGQLVLAFPPTLSTPDMMQALQRFRAEFPEVDLSLRVGPSREVSNLVRRGEASLGLRYRHDDDPQLTVTPIKIERMRIVCAAGHPLAGSPAVSAAQLSEETWIAVPTNAEEPDWGLRATLAGYGIVARRFIPMADTVAQRSLIAAGFGIGLMTATSVHGEVADATLRIIAAPLVNTDVPIVMISRRGGYHSKPALRLARLIRTNLGSATAA